MEEWDSAREVLKEFGRFMRQKPHPEMNRYARGEMLALGYLHVQGGKALPGQMAADMELSSARVAVLLKRMEAKGLISRQVSEEDRRKAPVCLTEKGLNQCREKDRELHQKAARLMEMLGPEDASALIRILRRINAFADKEREDMGC